MAEKLTVFDFFSTDVEDLANFQPHTNEEVYFQLEICVGPSSGKWSTIFSILIATSEAIRKYNRRPKTEKTKYFIVHEYNWPVIKKKITDIVENASYQDNEMNDLQKHFNWEYE